MEPNWKDITYLKHGNPKQRKVYDILFNNQIIEKLKLYNPIVVGTIPIGIDIATSDIDIICEVYNFKDFITCLKELFINFPDFKLSFEENVAVCNFFIDDFEIEIYATDKESQNQNGYRHMVIEHRILKLFPNEFKNEVICLKESGVKTEPAFGKVLGITQNPYEYLLHLETYSYAELKNELFKNRRIHHDIIR